MKITNIVALVLRLPEVTSACDGTQDTCLIRVDTEAGISGWGEVDSCPTVVKAIIEAPLSHQICNGIANALIGADSLAIAVCNARLEAAVNYYGRSGVGVHAMAGVNMALWDIAGKVYDQPIYRLLGGAFKKRFRAYASVLFGDTTKSTYESARRLIEAGFTAVKFGWGPMGQGEKNDIALVREARRGLGEQTDLMIDAGQVWEARTALRRAEQFAEFRPFWLEEPLQPDDIAGYAKLCAASPIPIAAGESESRLFEFERLLDEAGVDWVQPDPGRCGISTMLAVGRAAYARRRHICNHSFKSGITIAASLQVMAALPLPDSSVFEFCMSDSPLRHEVTKENFEIQDGYVHTPEGPGLGVTVNLDTVERYGVK